MVNAPYLVRVHAGHKGRQSRCTTLEVCLHSIVKGPVSEGGGGEERVCGERYTKTQKGH